MNRTETEFFAVRRPNPERGYGVFATKIIEVGMTIKIVFAKKKKIKIFVSFFLKKKEQQYGLNCL